MKQSYGVRDLSWDPFVREPICPGSIFPGPNCPITNMRASCSLYKKKGDNFHNPTLNIYDLTTFDI